MPAPGSDSYSAEAKVAAGEALKALIDTGSAGRIEILNEADTVLATFTLTDPCGSVNGTTGVLTLGYAASTVNASASGTASWGRVCESDGTVHWSAPAQAGSTAVEGKVVINTLTLVSGSPVTIISTTLNG